MYIYICIYMYIYICKPLLIVTYFVAHAAKEGNLITKRKIVKVWLEVSEYIKCKRTYL